MHIGQALSVHWLAAKLVAMPSRLCPRAGSLCHCGLAPRWVGAIPRRESWKAAASDAKDRRSRQEEQGPGFRGQLSGQRRESGEHQAAFRGGDRATELPRGLDPFPDDHLGIRERFAIRLAVGGAASEFRDLSLVVRVIREEPFRWLAQSERTAPVLWLPAVAHMAEGAMYTPPAVKRHLCARLRVTVGKIPSRGSERSGYAPGIQHSGPMGQ